ncbi:MAG: OsmC family protein [Acidobacteriia bacterium]|nr:OsmC family protein [Terriglobia bacterium]
MEARQIPASQDRLDAEAIGEVELEEKVLVIRRIHVVLNLKAAEEHRETAVRVHGFYADRCPVYRTLRTAIHITTELNFISQ